MFHNYVWLQKSSIPTSEKVIGNFGKSMIRSRKCAVLKKSIRLNWSFHPKGFVVILDPVITERITLLYKFPWKQCP